MWNLFQGSALHGCEESGTPNQVEKMDLDDLNQLVTMLEQYHATKPLDGHGDAIIEWMLRVLDEDIAHREYTLLQEAA